MSLISQARTLFGAADCKLDIKMYAKLAQLSTPDQPANMTTTVGNFAFNEICISDIEYATFQDTHAVLVSEDRSKFIAEVVERLNEAAAQSNNKKIAQLAETIDSEFQHLKKAFFVRSRSIEVTRISTNEVIGRIVSFPDQVSDDYGNNLEPRCEKGMNPGKVLRGDRALGLPTVYLGHRQGAVFAVVSACLNDAQCITLDATFLSEILSQDLLQDDEAAPVIDVAGDAHDWHVIATALEVMTVRNAAAVPQALPIIEEITKQRAADKAKEREEKAKEEAKEHPEKQQKKGDEPTASEFAAAYFAKREANKITGLIPQGPASRFEQSGKYPASSICALLAEPMTKITPAPYPYVAAQS